MSQCYLVLANYASHLPLQILQQSEHVLGGSGQYVNSNDIIFICLPVCLLFNFQPLASLFILKFPSWPVFLFLNFYSLALFKTGEYVYI